MPNVENINKVITLISACQPDNFDPEPGVPIFDMRTFVNESHTCGTIACIGGYAYLAAGGSVEDADRETLVDNKTEKKAIDFLGITEEQGDKLFFPTVPGVYDATPQEAIKVLEHLRDTGEVDWTVFDK